MSGDEAAFDQPRGDVLERVGEVAVVVERIDQDHHGGGVCRREPHAGELAAQVVLQRLRDCVAIAFVAVVEVVVGPRRAGRLADAVEVLALGAVLPVLAVGAAELGGAVDRGRLARVRAVAARLGGALGFAFAGALGARQPLGERLEGRRRVLLDLEERVLLEHLLDFLVQLERRQLEQPDRLLQLRRQREVLR